MLSECIDSVELQALAAANERRQSRVDSINLARNFKRLAEMVAVRVVSGEAPSVLTIDLCFENGAEGYPCVDIELAGQIDLECQRCLRPFEFSFHLQTRLTILNSDAQSSQIADPFDSVVMTTDGLNMLTIVEDEILSALPIAPIHESDADCTVFDDELLNMKNQAGKPNRPFANLSALMGEGGNDGVD